MLESEQILQERYQLQKKLGRTAAGRQTWLAVDLQSDERVALKLLAFSPQMQWEEFKLFEREAQVLQALNHPQIPRYRDYFSLDRENETGLPWFGLVQDYIPGETLQEKLERGNHFTKHEVRAIATQILNILIYLHELSPPVLHRDIKPSNLILGEDKQVYLVDFGAVQAQAAVTGVTFTVVGTSGYAPLEQFWGRAVPASDLYALGATLIHLLTGIAPAELPQKDLRIQFADRLSLNPNFVSWIERLTEPAIEKRFGSARQALEKLKSELKSEQVLPQKTKSTAIPNITKFSPGFYFHKNRITLQISSQQLIISFLINSRIYAISYTIQILICLGLLLFLKALFYEVIIFYIHLYIPMSFFYIIIGYTAINLIKLYCDRVIVVFDRKLNSLKIKREIFNFTYRVQSTGSVRDIQSIFLSLIKDDLSQVVIYYHNGNSYALDGKFSKKESIWLAQEIQDWLNPK